MMRKAIRAAGSAICLTLLAGCLEAGEKLDADSWMRGNIGSEEDLLCQKKSDTDFFFVAKRTGQIKVGSLIDVTSNSKVPLTFELSWHFQDSEGNHIEKSTPPDVVRRDYLHSGEKTYAENISYRHLLNSEKQVMVIKIWVSLKKYKDTEITNGETEKINICNTTLLSGLS